MYIVGMTMMSFRVDDSESDRLTSWVDRLGVERSELLRDALRRHLDHLGSERDTDIWLAQPRSNDECSLDAIAFWDVAEDWSDWADETR